MARNEVRTRTPGGQGPAGRPPLEPADPLSGTTAFVQTLILLGLPIGLLLFARVILHKFFPGLGY
ncbi:MAG TPA: hypothetical protein VFB49_06400 [Patescibacteria group bacterium]|nr:hypothetical protein [Patescibacteria group bacterium]